jgi:hypothetical protein
MMDARKRLEELAGTNALGLVADDDAVWASCIAAIGQAAHAALSERLGAVDAAPAWSARSARSPRKPRGPRGDDLYAPAPEQVLAALGTSWLSASRIADSVGATVEGADVIDMRALARVLAALVAAGDVVEEGERRGKRYEIGRAHV